MTVRPCRYPDCADVDGNPKMTERGICDSCRRRYRRLLFEWIPEDYLSLLSLPAPVRDGDKVRSGTREYGHPAEWASDNKAAIAHLLNSAHDWLAGYRGDPPAPERRVSEQLRISRAITYLDGRFDALCTFPDAGAVCVEFVKLHRSIRVGLGFGRKVSYVPGPCPKCQVPRLYRVSLADNDQVDCRECGDTMSLAEYRAWTTVLVNDALDG